MRKLFAMLLSCVLLLATGVAFAATEAGGADFESGVIQADGYGLPPSRILNKTQARLMAKRAAMVDAQRNLIEAVGGVQVDAETTVQDMQLVSDVVKTKVSGLLKGARVISTEYESDGTCHVVMSAPMYGANSLASAVMPQNYAVESFPQTLAPEPVVEVAPSVTTTQPIQQPIQQTTPVVAGDHGRYTGLIVDCTGLGLQSAMSPVVKTTGGDAIYGNKNIDSKLAIQKGMVGYAKNINGNVSRAGVRPLVVKGVGVDRFCNPVISVADAQTVLAENQLTRFLDNAAVVFVL